jgi:hypothetical protein
MEYPPIHDTLIIGGGPAGLAPLLAAAAGGRLPALLAGGLAIVEQGASLGAGRLGAYALATHNPARAFLAVLADQTDRHLAALRHHPAALRLHAAGNATVPLAWVAALQSAIGAALTETLAAAGATVLTGHEALRATRLAGGAWSTRIRRRADGAETELLARRLVLATGGHQPAGRLHAERIAGLALLPRFADRLIQSDSLLTAAEPPRHLARGGHRLAVVIGAGASAEAVAARLLAQGCAIAQLHRGAPPPGPAPAALRRVGLDEEADLARRLLEEAALIVPALGYRPRALTLHDANGQDIRLLADRPGQPLIDRQCRVLDARSRAIPQLFGLGLAAGYDGAAEPRGRAESLPLWQDQAGRVLAHALLAEWPRAAMPALAVATLARGDAAARRVALA